MELKSKSDFIRLKKNYEDMRKFLFILLLIIAGSFFINDAYACSVALSTDKTSYDLGEKMIISVWTWPDGCNDGEKENVKVTIFGNGQSFKNLLVGNEPVEYSYSIGSGYREGEYKIYATGSGSNTEIHVGVGEFDSNLETSKVESKPQPQTKVIDGMLMEYLDDDTWVETEDHYFNRIMVPLISNIIVIGIIIGIVVIVIYKINENRKIHKRNNIQINKEQTKQEKIQYSIKRQQNDEIKKLKERVEELEKDKEKKK